MRLVIDVKNKQSWYDEKDVVDNNIDLKFKVKKSKIDELIDLLISRNIISEEDLTKMKS